MFMSMTGYGRSSRTFYDRELIIEIKTVNHKGLDINVRSPVDFIPFESQVIKYLNQHLERGRVDVFIGFAQSTNSLESNLELDIPIAKKYYKLIEDLSSTFDLSPQITALQFISLPGILKSQNEENRVIASWELMKPLLQKASDNLMKMRTVEGAELQKDVMGRLKTVEQKIKKIHILIPRAMKTRKDKLKENIQNLFKEHSQAVDPNQVAAAAISYLEQCDVTEELVRVDSHISQFHETAKSKEGVGRRIDFILQELFREFTTIGAKTNHPDIGKLVVDVKTELDKIKQQIANIE